MLLIINYGNFLPAFIENAVCLNFANGSIIVAAALQLFL